MTNRVLALVRTWLILDFFGESRRSGQEGSTLTTTIFGQSFLGLVFAAILWPDRQDGTLFVAYAAANLSLSTLLMGISVLGDPLRLDRVRADEELVRTAPVGRNLLAVARALHGGFSLSLITIGIALPPAILSYWASGRHLWVVPAYLVMACLLSGLVAGALFVGIAHLVRWFGAARGELVGGTLKALALAGGFVGFALSMRHLGGTADDLPFGRLAAQAWPPYWGARLLHDPVGAWPYGVALIVCGAAIYVASLALQRASRPVAAARSGRSWLARLDRRIAGEGPLLGVVAFTSTMLYRSPGYRAKVLPIFGLPAAMVGLALWEADAHQSLLLIGITLQFPSIYLPLLVAFLPHADQEGSAWVFATSPEESSAGLARRAATISLSTHVLLPVHLAGLLVMLCSEIGILASVGLACFSLGTGIAVAALAMRSLEGTPFTDESDGVAIDTGNLIGFALVLSLIGGGYASISGHPAGAALGVVVLVVGARTVLGRYARAG